MEDRSSFVTGAPGKKSILAPLSRCEDVQSLIDAGADEFYFGIVDPRYLNANKREQPAASFDDFGKLECALEIIKKSGRHSYLALNERLHHGTETSVRSYMVELDKRPFDGYIVQDYAILKLLEEIGSVKEVHLSSLAQVWNDEAIRFFTESFPQITRVVFSRDLTWAEMAELASYFPEKRFEAFVLNEWCYNVDGICSSIHFGNIQASSNYVCLRERYYVDSKGSPPDRRQFRCMIRNRPACFACSIHFLSRIQNLVSFKIVGRGRDLPTIARSVDFVRAVRDAIALDLTYNDFVAQARKNFILAFDRECNVEICQFAHLEENGAADPFHSDNNHA
jgi:U32 family peptidase